ncbi:MAG TPA: MazG family protein [Pseudonocardiaceae bacterium]|nr:MazG family protein [Pseudonocardiaceae bacterium]
MTSAHSLSAPSALSESAVVVLDPRLGAVLPVAAVPLLRTAARVYVGAGLRAESAAFTSFEPAPAPEALCREAVEHPVLLIVADTDDPGASAALAAGIPLIGTASPAGAELLAAVSVMDRLRSPGGCPWDAAQTHQTLRQYLVEETFELLDAIEDGDRVALREELGDVLLQVLFHARVAAEDAGDPFTVDDVAGELVAKLVGRHPHVFAEGDPAVKDAASQERRWEELKREEKQRESSVDGVALGQPAVALAAKLVQRATRAGLPADLLPGGDGEPGTELVGLALFGLAARAKLAGGEPEGELRAVARQFAADIRAAERSARAAGLDPATLDADAWRAHWPVG